MDQDAKHWAMVEDAWREGRGAAGRRGLIGRLLGRGGDEEAVKARAAGSLKAKLKGMSAGEIAAFKVWLEDQMQRAYKADLWAGAYVMMGGCGDDMFEYFRLWLVAQGREVFERALTDPDSLADLDVEEPDMCDFEALAYVPVEAYEEMGLGDLYEVLPEREWVDVEMEPDTEENVARWMERFPRVARKWGMLG